MTQRGLVPRLRRSTHFLWCGALGVIGLVMRVRGQPADEEFLQEIGDTRAPDADRRILEGQPGSTPAACRIVKIRDAAGG